MAQLPRVVVVTRPTELELLVAEHGTRGQAQFALGATSRFEDLIARDELQRSAVALVMQEIPSDWRRGRISRDDLRAFLFEPGDVVVAIGQDGLVPNVAKYLATQIVLGINADPANYAGMLVRHPPSAAGELMRLAVAGRVEYEERTMVEVRLDDGQSLRALNEIFVGHRSHQSAKYRIVVGAVEERQSSSGFIVATGTGCTGWARSIARERATPLIAPAPTQKSLALYVREAFPAPGYATDLTSATLTDQPAKAISEMSDGGVIFGDGIEDDFLQFSYGRVAHIGSARDPLRLII